MTRHSDTPTQSHRLRFELITASLLLAFGLFVLPALVFWVGGALLGPYGADKPLGLGAFYGDFYGGLASGVMRTWALALGPLVVISLIRLLFLRRRDEADHEPVAAPPQAAPRAPVDPRRVEPRVSLD